MRVLTAFVVLLCITACAIPVDSEGAEGLGMDSRRREEGGHYDVIELRELTTGGKW